MVNKDLINARQEQNDLESLHCLDEECVHLQRAGNYLKAFDCMERALVLRRHFFGAESPEVLHACKALAEMCNLLSMSFLQQDNYKVTIDLLKKAEILTEHHPSEKATTLNNLACYYRRLGKLHTAMTCLKKALEIERKLCDVRSTADTHLNICAVLSQLGRHQQALEHAQSALLTLQEEFFQAPADKNDSIVTIPTAKIDRVSVMCIAYHNIGVEYEFLKDFDNSVVSYKKGVGMAEQYMGVEHPITTTIRNSYLAAKRTVSTKASSRQGVENPKSPQRPLQRTPVSNSPRLPNPMSIGKHHVIDTISQSPCSIIADTLSKQKVLPPLEKSMCKTKVDALSPEDPFFSPRYRFGDEERPKPSIEH